MRTIKIFNDGCQSLSVENEGSFVIKLNSMDSSLNPEIKEVIEAVHYRPSISVIVPFEPKMSLQTELQHRLKVSAARIEQELEKSYPPEITQLMTQKLNRIISGLNFNTHKKSIAIYLSPVFEKVLYMDIEVEEKIVVDETFEIRDLIYCKKQLHKYLLLVLSAEESRMYLGNTKSFIRILSGRADSAHTFVNDVVQRIANFSDMAERKETLLEKFLHQVDNNVGIILNAYKLPLFIMGPKRVVGHFKKISGHSASLTGCVYGNYDGMKPDKLQEILAPQVENWKHVMQADLLHRLEEAAGKKRMESGIRNVCREAGNRKVELLVVEKNYFFPAQATGNEKIYQPSVSCNEFTAAKDMVDDVIEQVLNHGGDVEFVDEGILKDYHHIAAVLFY